MTKFKLGLAAGAAAVMAFGVAAMATARPNTVADEATFDAARASMILAGASPQDELVCVERSESGATEAFYFASRPAANPDRYFSLTRTDTIYSLAATPTTSEHRAYNNRWWGQELRGEDRADAQAVYDRLSRAAHPDGYSYDCSYTPDYRPSSPAYEEQVRAHLALEQ